MTEVTTVETTQLALVCTETNEGNDNDNDNESNDGINGNENNTEETGWFNIGEDVAVSESEVVEVIEEAEEQPPSPHQKKNATVATVATVSIYPSADAEPTDTPAAVGEKRKRSEAMQSTKVTVGAETVLNEGNSETGDNSEITGTNDDERPTKRRDIVLSNRFETVRERFAEVDPEDRKAAEEKILKMAEDVHELTTLMSEKRAL